MSKIARAEIFKTDMMISVNIRGDGNSQLRHALRDVGFYPGEKVVIIPAEDYEALLAAAQKGKEE